MNQSFTGVIQNGYFEKISEIDRKNSDIITNSCNIMVKKFCTLFMDGV